MLKRIVNESTWLTRPGVIFTGLVFQVLSVQAEVSVSRQSELVHLVQHDCGSCHGMTLGGGLGPPLTVERLQSRTADELTGIIRYGVPNTPMPPWDSILSSEEIEWIVKQLQSGMLLTSTDKP